MIPRISVIVSNFNGAKYLPRLLETLDGQVGVDLETIVVDRNSTDESAGILAGHRDVKVVLEPPESGLVTGYAVGAEHATAEFLFFCNEDMWFDPSCLRGLVERIDIPNRICAADPWQWTYDGKTWIHGGTRLTPVRLDLNCPYPFRRYDFTVALTAGDTVPFGCAGAVMIHRQVYLELGGWDRGFFLDHEDVDFFLRAWQHGWKCVTVPEAKVYHAVNVSNTKSIGNGRQRVSRRRYISGRSSLPILGVKYFSFGLMCLSLLLWIVSTARHAIVFRTTQTWWDVLAGCELVVRLGPALRFRWSSTAVRRQRPGELFFCEPSFQRLEAEENQLSTLEIV